MLNIIIGILTALLGSAVGAYLAYYFGVKQLTRGLQKQGRAQQSRDLFMSLTELTILLSMPELIPLGYEGSAGKKLGDALNHFVLSGTVAEINLAHTVLAVRKDDGGISLGAQPPDIVARINEIDALRLAVANSHRRDMGLEPLRNLPPVHLYNWKHR